MDDEVFKVYVQKLILLKVLMTLDEGDGYSRSPSHSYGFTKNNDGYLIYFSPSFKLVFTWHLH